MFTGYADWGVRLAGELLFVDFAERDELAAFARRNGISMVTPFDRWSWLLEPYLDTDVDLPSTDRRLLDDGGMDQSTIDQVRARVAPAMWLYNFGQPLWEWSNRSHTDLLRATRPGLVYPDDALVGGLRDQYAIGPDPLFDLASSAEIYHWSMGIALSSRGWDTVSAVPP